MRRARLDHHHVAGPGDDDLPAGLGLRFFGETLEPLRLLRIKVVRGHEAAQSARRVDHDHLAARVFGGLEEGHTLSGDGVLYAPPWRIISRCLFAFRLRIARANYTAKPIVDASTENPISGGLSRGVGRACSPEKGPAAITSGSERADGKFLPQPA
jgi:hypothetical protein